ncbi:hypothetical protein CUPS4066_09795, partial [Campylobacter upsaliensis]|nr:hypothetical protein [Campylobacter upsaliensis]
MDSSDFTKGETLPLNSKQSIAQKNTLSLNDEPLEVEVIEEIGLNEPMKFLEFQQRKLLTYIKQNTPLRLLEHKKELKTRELLNFLEQSALNGKEKAFLMRHLERDLDKIEAKIKEKETKELIDKNKELQEHIESTPQKVDNSTSQSLAQTKLSPSAQAKKALRAKQAKQIYEFFTAKGTNKDKITTLENFSDFMFELNKKLDRKWEFLEQQSPNDLAKYKQILTEGIEQAEQVGRISPKQKQRALQDLDLLIDNFSYIKDTHIYSFHPSKVSETLHKIQYKAYDLEDLSDDEFIKIFFYKKLPKTLDEDFEREFSKRKDRIYPFLKPMLAKGNSLEYINEQNLKDFFYKGVLRDEAIPEMIAKEKGVKIQDLSIAKIQDFKINSPRQSIEQALEIKPLKEFGTNYAEFYKDGKGAIQKLLAEKQGQVSGAFYKEGLGDIDLVWGDENFG